MHQFTSKRRLRTIERLSTLERQQLVEVTERMWGEDLSAELAFAHKAFGRSCVLWSVERDGVPLLDLWTDGDPWMNGVLLYTGTAKLAPVMLVQGRFLSLVQGFEDLASALNTAPKSLALPKQIQEYLIRDATPEDAEAIVALLNPIIAAGIYTIMEPLTLAEQRDFMQSFPARGVFLVAHRESGVVEGTQSIEPLRNKANQHIAEISTFVSLSSQRKKLGQMLSQETFRRAKEKGLRKLIATVRADNPVAISFYQSQGFRELGRAMEHALVQGRYLDEVFLEKIL
jgi:L-amino acid N-acyltransferase YncA